MIHLLQSLSVWKMSWLWHLCGVAHIYYSDERQHKRLSLNVWLNELKIKSKRNVTWKISYIAKLVTLQNCYIAKLILSSSGSEKFQKAFQPYSLHGSQYSQQVSGLVLLHWPCWIKYNIFIINTEIYLNAISIIEQNYMQRLIWNIM